MKIVDIFIAIFIGALLFDFVVKMLVDLYLDVLSKIKKK